MLRQVIQRLIDLCSCCWFRDHSKDETMRYSTIEDYHELLKHYKKQIEEQGKNKSSCC